MIATRKQTRRQISDLKMDLEVINPIESKTLLGGEWYNGMLDTVYVYGSGYQNNYGGDYQLSSGMYDYGGDWNNDGNYGGGGDSGGSGDSLAVFDVVENPSATELWWLSTKVSVQELSKMIDNKNFALDKASNVPGFDSNGLGDAFRHALWSAADAADIGLARTIEFHTLHETAHPETNGSNQMDLFNNNWGYNWFSQNGDPVSNMTQFITDFNTAVANGQIQTHL